MYIKKNFYLVCFMLELTLLNCFLQALLNITDQQIYRDLVAGEEDNSFLKE